MIFALLLAVVSPFADYRDQRPGRKHLEDFLTGFVRPDGKVWGRPVGVAVAADGALLVTEDASGTIWRVSRSR